MRDDKLHLLDARLVKEHSKPQEKDVVSGKTIVKLLYVLAGEAESLLLDATGLQEQFNPETYEISAYRYDRLRKALDALDAAEEAEAASE